MKGLSSWTEPMNIEGGEAADNSISISDLKLELWSVSDQLFHRLNDIFCGDTKIRKEQLGRG